MQSDINGIVHLASLAWFSDQANVKIAYFTSSKPFLFLFF